jgi:hypothetical protein
MSVELPLINSGITAEEQRNLEKRFLVPFPDKQGNIRENFDGHRTDSSRPLPAFPRDRGRKIPPAGWWIHNVKEQSGPTWGAL